VKSSRKFFKAVSAAAVMSVLTVSQSFACPACGSANGSMPPSPLTDGMNLGILTLFVVITTVLGSIAGFFVYIIRKEAALAAKTAAENLSEVKV